MRNAKANNVWLRQTRVMYVISRKLTMNCLREDSKCTGAGDKRQQASNYQECSLENFQRLSFHEQLSSGQSQQIGRSFTWTAAMSGWSTGAPQRRHRPALLQVATQDSSANEKTGN